MSGSTLFRTTSPRSVTATLKRRRSVLKNTGKMRCILVGKDILRFHTVYWFSFLTAAGLTLPKTVYAHGMWLDADGRKMGKTTGNVIEVDVLHKHFQVDALRYFLLREMVFGQDGKFGYENLIDRANADLASGLGNLASRTFSMITKYREGADPERQDRRGKLHSGPPCGHRPGRAGSGFGHRTRPRRVFAAFRQF